MQTATILHMSNDQRNNDDRPYDPIRDMKRQLDTLSGHIGGMRTDMTEIRTALTGNEFGNDGLVARQERIEGRQLQSEVEIRKMAAKLDEFEKSAKLNRRYVMAFIAALGTVAGTFLKIIIDHLVPVKK